MCGSLAFGSGRCSQIVRARERACLGAMKRPYFPTILQP